MKKAIVIICLLMAFLITYFLQANFFSWFTIAGVKPNLFIILILFISLFAGIKMGISYGLFFGLFLDIILGKSLGTYIIMFIIVSILGAYFDKNFSKDSRLTIMLMVMASTLIFEVGIYALNSIVLNGYVEVLNFIKVLVIEIIYNAVLTTILYPVMQIVGYKIEDIFKGQKILTRYF